MEKSNPFPAVRKAREALRGKALEILEEYLATIRLATSAGKYEESLRAYQWLLDHVPGEDGQRVFESSVDKLQPIEGPKGPLIQIGLQLGGINEPKVKEISPVIIEVVPLQEGGPGD